MSPDWKYKITIEKPDWHEVEQWCKVYIGEFDKDWYKLGIDPMEYINEGRTRSVWYFKQHVHAVQFTLRWA